MGSRMEVRINAAVGHKEDENRYADKAAADTNERTEDADEQAKQ